jgi:DNA-binding transcriptional ArsR family regulator
LAEYVNPPFVGYIAALGIELSIVGLSLRIGELKRSGLDARFFVATLIAVATVSALANVAMGYSVKFGEPLTVANVGQLDIVQAVVSLAATGLISLVTFALAELVGQDVSAAAKVSSKSVKPAAVPVPTVTPELSNTEALTVYPMPIEQARAAKGDSDTQQKAAAVDAMVSYLTSNPDATVSELARVIGKSRPTVYNYLDELVAAGKLHRNGQITILDSVTG